jgi:hypothetical protein
MSDASCFACLAMDQLQMVNTALLCQLLQTLSPMATCDPATLLESAKCFAGCASPAQLMVIQTQLLCEILAVAGGIGPGGGSGVTCGVGAPAAPPSGTCGIYYSTDTGSIYIWDGAAWILRLV